MAKIQIVDSKGKELEFTQDSNAKYVVPMTQTGSIVAVDQDGKDVLRIVEVSPNGYNEILEATQIIGADIGEFQVATAYSIPLSSNATAVGKKYVAGVNSIAFAIVPDSTHTFKAELWEYTQDSTQLLRALEIIPSASKGFVISDKIELRTGNFLIRVYNEDASSAHTYNIYEYRHYKGGN